jgi:hypothetical protein
MNGARVRRGATQMSVVGCVAWLLLEGGRSVAYLGLQANHLQIARGGERWRREHDFIIRMSNLYTF